MDEGSGADGGGAAGEPADRVRVSPIGARIDVQIDHVVAGARDADRDDRARVANESAGDGDGQRVQGRMWALTLRVAVPSTILEERHG